MKDSVDDSSSTTEQHSLIERWEIYSRDTSQEIEQRRLAAAWGTPPWRKLWMAAEMSQVAMNLTRIGLRQRYPDAEEAEIHYRLAELLYGPETARALCREHAKKTNNHDA